MRFSDWSSDVCSSDLGECLHLRFERIDPGDDALELFEQAFVAAAEDAGEQAIEHGCSGWEAGFDAGTDTDQVAGFEFPKRKKSARRPFWQRDIVRGDAGRGYQACFRRPGRRSHSGAGLDRRCRRRSEEHTSELQSLMRISYADF